MHCGITLYCSLISLLESYQPDICQRSTPRITNTRSYLPEYDTPIATKVLCRVSSYQTNALKFLIFRHLEFLIASGDWWSRVVGSLREGTDERTEVSILEPYHLKLEYNLKSSWSTHDHQLHPQMLQFQGKPPTDLLSFCIDFTSIHILDRNFLHIVPKYEMTSVLKEYWIVDRVAKYTRSKLKVRPRSISPFSEPEKENAYSQKWRSSTLSCSLVS